MEHRPFQKTDYGDEDVILRTILEGTAGETGRRFFDSLVSSVAAAFGTHGAWVAEYLPTSRKLHAYAMLLGDRMVHGFEYPIDGTPCLEVIEETRLVCVPDRVVELYPGDPDLKAEGAVSYLGFPLLDTDQTVIGNLAILDTKPLVFDERVETVFKIFAARATAELQRLNAESVIRESQVKLSRLVGSAMDGIVELDGSLHITMMNPAAEGMFGCQSDEVVGKRFALFLLDESAEQFASYADDLLQGSEGRRSLWIPGGLMARSRGRGPFAAEATLSVSSDRSSNYFTLVVRDVNERIEAEQRIRTLTSEAEYLKEEISKLRQSDKIIGSSPAMTRVLAEISEVAPTNATVLLLGETGVGKEIIADAIHDAGQRKDHPLITVNCGAIPPTLIESEFFGHVKGAFTGATDKREGRFSLADGGTIFLDEVGELPPELQAKLLRVLQQGVFEAVGSSESQKVDVRVIAATNRDLKKMMVEGTFRADLFYRLNVFPITIPPLRDRGDDVIELADAFVGRFSKRLGKKVEPLSATCKQRLRSYDWPGNVRELQNVIERAIITSRDGRLDFERALPEAPARLDQTVDEPMEPIRTAAELEELERQNIIRALEARNWKVSGDQGAAHLLGLPPTTLTSRMKALGIERPR